MEFLTCKTSNVYVAAYINYLIMFKNERYIKEGGFEWDAPVNGSSRRMRKAFVFYVDTEVEVRDPETDEIKTITGQDYFDMMIDNYFKSEFKSYIDSVKLEVAKSRSFIESNS